MLRLSELLGSEVRDGNERTVGHVRDVRLVQDGEVTGEFGRALRVQGIVVGPRWIPFRMGVGRPEIRGPWAARGLARWLGRNARFYRWDEVVGIEPGRMSVRGGGSELRLPEE